MHVKLFANWHSYPMDYKYLFARVWEKHLIGKWHRLPDKHTEICSVSYHPSDRPPTTISILLSLVERGPIWKPFPVQFYVFEIDTHCHHLVVPSSLLLLLLVLLLVDQEPSQSLLFKLAVVVVSLPLSNHFMCTNEWCSTWRQLETASGVEG